MHYFVIKSVKSGRDLVVEPLCLQSGTTTILSYENRAAQRSGGMVLIVLGSVVGGIFMSMAMLGFSSAGGDTTSSLELHAERNLVTGFAVAGIGIGTGIALRLQRDRVHIQTVPHRRRVVK